MDDHFMRHDSRCYLRVYCIRLNFRRVKLSRFVGFCIFTFVVAESQAGEI